MNTHYNITNTICIYNMANDITFDRDTFNLINYKECKEVVCQLIHSASHTVISTNPLTDFLWVLIHTDEDKTAINTSDCKRWAHEAN